MEPRQPGEPEYLGAAEPGTVVLLNGTSCSGKSSIARAVQAVMDEPWLHVGLDHFEAMQPQKDGKRIHAFYGQGIRQPDLVPVLHKAAADFVRRGANVVNEHIFLHRRWLRDAVAQYGDLPVLFVGVLCPLEELERRERERHKGVQIGQSANQFRMIAWVHDQHPYDLAFDTTATTPEACAAEIKAAVRAGKARGLRRLEGASWLKE